MYKRYTTVAGKTLLVRKTESSRVKTETKKRKAKKNPTPESVAKINKINQERNLTGMLNHNFKPKDKWIVLSYPDILPVDECMRRIKNFKRNIRNAAKKKGIQYKIIESIGIGEKQGKPHHHIVISKEITRDIIIKYWPEQHVHIETLWSDGNYNRVAKYMLKNAYQSKEERGKCSKAYRCSRNVATPRTRKEDMKRPIKYDPEDIKPHTGYYIDKDSIRIYDHPITGASCIEYIEVSLQEEPRIKTYSKGKKAGKEKYYKEHWEEQLSFDELDI